MDYSDHKEDYKPMPIYQNNKNYQISASAKQNGKPFSPKICENYCETTASARMYLFHNMLLTKKTHSMMERGFKKILRIFHNYFYLPKFQPPLHRLLCLLSPNKLCQSLSCYKNVTVTLVKSVTPKTTFLHMLYLKITI